MYTRSMQTIYLFLVHTGSRGNLFHEIPGSMTSILRKISNHLNIEKNEIVGKRNFLVVIIKVGKKGWGGKVVIHIF